MKVLWSWLLELCDLDRTPTVEEGAAALTRGGLEIEALTDLGAGFAGVVVAEVVARRPHPSSDKLSIVSVITAPGGAATEVVCGAPNVPPPGHRVLWAQVGATLPGGLTLAPKAVKGVVSPGMLCSETELGVGDDDDGIVVLPPDDPTPLGAPAQRALGVEDHLLEVNAPANRGDLLGHLGVARELCALVGGRLVLPDADLGAYAAPADGPAVRVELDDPAACPRYLARLVDGVTVAPSPRRFAQRLRAVGVRPLSNLVDVTNYVMFELGQPLHAFDAQALTAGTIRVGGAAPGERFTTLDGVERALEAGELLIRDGDVGVALAGVMGGLHSEVTPATRRVLLEAASFAPRGIRRTARRLGLHSEASHRFERGVDPALVALASARAARLLCQLGGGRVVGEAVDAYPRPAAPAPVELRLARARAITGVALTRRACADALGRLGFAVEDGAAGEADGTVRVTPPSARADVTREIDVIEEIVRLVGYDQVPTSLPALRVAPPAAPPARAEVARRALAAAGASEAITFAFQHRDRLAALRLADDDRRARPIALVNPMSADQAIMRTSLLPNLLAAVARNASHGRRDVALFEVGSVFLRREADALADEPVQAAGVLSGRRPAQLGEGAPWDAFDAKALALEAARAVCGRALTAQATTGVPYLHPGVAGELRLDDAVVGWFGEVHPETRRALGVDAPVFAFELSLASLPDAAPAQMRPVPRFPGSSRDVSLLLGVEIPAARVAELVTGAGQALVVGVRLLEDYRDAKLPPGTKSMLWSIAYRAADRTLTDQEVEQAHEAIVARLCEALPAQRR